MSEKYYNIKYHFKSIDTWLKGIHKSFCPEHKWHEGEYKLLDKDKVNKYSAFYSFPPIEVIFPIKNEIILRINKELNQHNIFVVNN